MIPARFFSFVVLLFMVWRLYVHPFAFKGLNGLKVECFWEKSKEFHTSVEYKIKLKFCSFPLKNPTLNFYLLNLCLLMKENHT